MLLASYLQVKAAVKDALIQTIPNYRDDLDLQSILDFFQENVGVYCITLFHVDFHFALHFTVLHIENFEIYIKTLRQCPLYLVFVIYIIYICINWGSPLYG